MNTITEVCWKGYRQVGMKKKNGKLVPNCVPIDEYGIGRFLDAPGTPDPDVNNDGKVDVTDDFHKKRRELANRYTQAKRLKLPIVPAATLEETYDLHEDELYEGEFCPACLAKYIVEHVKMLKEAEYQGRKVSLGKPFRTSGGPKKFSVYVKNKKGNVVKINFGDPNMRIKKNIPGRRKSFRARHKCSTAKDRTSARYWSCRSW